MRGAGSSGPRPNAGCAWRYSGLNAGKWSASESARRRLWVCSVMILRLVKGRSPGTSDVRGGRSEEHTSELQSLMRISYAVFCVKQQKTKYTFVYYLKPNQTNI